MNGLVFKQKYINKANNGFYKCNGGHVMIYVRLIAAFNYICEYMRVLRVAAEVDERKICGEL